MDKRIFIKNGDNHYEIYNLIARGGNGIVYRAKQQALSRFVAIKFITDQQTHQRFRREMEIAAQLQHKNIARVYDAGMYNNQNYLVMDYVCGQPLNEYLKKNTPSLQTKIKMFQKICSAIRYAHLKGIIHRDLKPNNILITEAGEPIVIDFGLAKRIHHEELDLTKTGEIIGTPNYMAPEQLSGVAEVDNRTDIFALGAIFYELITGKQMTSGRNFYEVLCCLQDNKIELPRKIVPKLSKSLQVIWQKSTSFKKSRRYEDIKYLIDDLRKFQYGKRISQNHSFLYSIPMLLALMVAVFLFVNKKQRSEEQNIQVNEEIKKRLQFVQKIQDLIVQKKYKQAKKICNDISVNPSQLLQIASNFYKHDKYKYTITILKKIPKNIPRSLRAEKCYYYSLSFYFLQRYTLAQKYFEKTLAIQSQNIKAKYYLGMCYLKQKMHDKALKLFLEIKEQFSDDVVFLRSLASLYLSTGKISDEKQAEHSLKECVAKTSTVDDYFRLGQLYIRQKKYYDAFYYLKKSLSTKRNFAAMELLHEIPYHEPILRENCYQLLLHECIKKYYFEPPNLFNKKWHVIRKRHRKIYISWLEASKNNSSILPFLSALKHVEKIPNSPIKHTVKAALVSLRYSESFDQELENFKLQCSPDIKRYIHNLQQEVQNLKIQEQNSLIIYKLTNMYMDKSWRKSELENIKVDVLLNLLHAYKSTFLKFLVAKGCLHLYGIKYLVNIIHNRKMSPLTRIIVTAVLRQSHIAAETNIYRRLKDVEPLCLSEREREFLCTLVASTIYTYHLARPVDTSRHSILKYEKEILRYLLGKKSPIVSVCAALSLHSLIANTSDDLWKSAEQLIFRVMKSKDLDLCSYTHYMFFNSATTRNNLRYLTKYKEALQHPYAFVRMIALDYAPLYKSFLQRVDVEIKKCLNSEIKEERFRAQFALIIDRNRKTIIFKEPAYIKASKKFTNLEHSTTYLFIFSNFYIESFTKGQPSLDTLVRTVRFFKYMQENAEALSPTCQCMVYYPLSLLNIHPSLERLQKIKDPLLKAYFLHQLHQELSVGNMKKLLPLIDAKSIKQKKEIAKEFLDAKDERIRSYAISSYLTFASKQELTKYYNKARSTSNEYFKETVARGIYQCIQNELIQGEEEIENNIAFFDLFSPRALDTLYDNYINKIRKLILSMRKKERGKFLFFKNWVKKTVELHPEEARHLYLLSIFSVEEKYISEVKNAFAVHKKYQAGYLDKIYLLKIIQFYFAVKNKDAFLSSMQQLQLTDTSSSFRLEIAKLYLASGFYDKALRLYEQNFLNNSNAIGPFYEIAEHHIQMVYIHIKNKDLATAKIMLDYLYKLYKRQQQKYDISRNTFFYHIRSNRSYEDIYENLLKKPR